MQILHVLEQNGLYLAIIMFFAGMAASFINMMAGGGSMITVGLMILLHVDPSVANGTNRIGVLVGTGTGALAFKSEKYTDLKQSFLLGICAVPGAIIGSLFSISISDELFKKILALVMIFILITLFIKKNKTTKTKKSVWIYPAMFLVGLYGGFIQIGVGFILMAFLRHLMSYDLVRTNMHKVFVVLIYTVPILLIFGISGNINWSLAFSMSAGNALGGWLSVKLAVRKGEVFVKIVLAIAIVLMALKFLFNL